MAIVNLLPQKGSDYSNYSVGISRRHLFATKETVKTYLDEYNTSEKKDRRPLAENELVESNFDGREMSGKKAMPFTHKDDVKRGTAPG